MTLDEFVARLQTLAAESDRLAIRLLSDATDDVVVIAQETGHEQTGRMIETMHRIGPYPIGSETLEARVESGMAYAKYEAARGGAHDWPTLTEQAAEPRLERLAEDTAAAIVRALTGGA